MEQKELFDSGIKKCTSCNCFLPEGFVGDLCPRCEESELFAEVKEYIRKNNVTEWDVAEKFHISRRKVRNWISQGRIEYRLDGEEHFGRMYERCELCGNPIPFGEVCPNCAKSFRGHAVAKKTDGDGKDMMWYNSH